jgi:hypothetical protein
MLDSDEAGMRGTINACEELKNDMEVIPIYITETEENGKGLGPADLSKEVVYEYLGMEVENAGREFCKIKG